MANDKKYPLEFDEKIPYFKDFIHRYSKEYYRQVRNKLINYILFLETKNKSILEADIEDVLDFFKNDINLKKVKRDTKLKWRNVLNAYYEYVKEIKEKMEKIPFINPVPSLNIYPFDEKPEKIEDLEKEADLMTYPIVKKVLNYLYFTQKRLFIIMSLLLYTGARIKEICRIRLSHLDIEECFFYVRLKSRKYIKRTGIYHFPRFFTKYLFEWIELIKIEYPTTKYLFPSPYLQDAHLSTKTPRRHLSILKNTLGLTCKLNPHAFRDFINTERFDRNMNKKYRMLLLNQTPKNVNVKNYLKKYKKRKELQKVYEKTFPFPEFKPQINLI